MEINDNDIKTGNDNMKIEDDKLDEASGGKFLGEYVSFSKNHNDYIKAMCDKCGKIHKFYCDFKDISAAGIADLKKDRYCDACGAKIDMDLGNTDLLRNVIIEDNKLDKVSGGKGVGMYMSYNKSEDSYAEVICDKCGKIHKFYFSVFDHESTKKISNIGKETKYCESCGAKLDLTNEQ